MMEELRHAERTTPEPRDQDPSSELVHTLDPDQHLGLLVHPHIEGAVAWSAADFQIQPFG